MSKCPNCGNETKGGMKFCPECGQDLAVAVPKDQRIPTEEVPLPPPPASGDQGGDKGASVPPPPGDQGGGGGDRGGLLTKVLVGLVALIIILVLLLAIARPPSENETSQAGDDTPTEKQKASNKASNKKSDPKNIEAAAGETAEASDRTLIVNEVQRNYVAPNPRVVRNKEGYEFVRVYLTITNTGDENFNYNVHDFKVQDSNGVLIPHKTVTDIPYPISYGSLAPSGTLEGNLVFEVPQGDSGLKLVYETSGMDKRTITVTL
jgi:hypothetical protein